MSFPFRTVALDWRHLVMTLVGLPAIAACGGIGLGSVTVGGADVEANVPAPTVADAGSKHFNGATPEAGATYDAASPGQAELGSPLCYITPYSCKPDQPACIYDDVDGGGVCEIATDCQDASVPVQLAACRVSQPKSSKSPQATCESAGQQSEGMSCSRSSDCAADLDCVGSSSSATGICRRYCCDGTCLGTNTFCDIEAVISTGTLIPVCADGGPCKLLGNNCPENQYCTVVNSETGQTACVAPGAESAGADCTRGKCGENLACIDDKCKALCSLSDPSACPGGETCMPLVALGNDVGVCTSTK
jgi:hypothetical protein